MRIKTSILFLFSFIQVISCMAKRDAVDNNVKTNSGSRSILKKDQENSRVNGDLSSSTSNTHDRNLQGKGKGKYGNTYTYATSTATSTAAPNLYSVGFTNYVKIEPSAVGTPLMYPPTSFRFQLTGGTCATSQNLQTANGEFQCPETISSGWALPIHVSIRSAQGYVYVDGVVENLYDIIQVGTTTGQPLTDTLIIKLTDANSQVQYMKLNTQTNMRLGDTFGALTLIEFTNPQQGIARIKFMSIWGLTEYIRAPDIIVSNSCGTYGYGKGKGGKGKGGGRYGYGYGGKSDKGVSPGGVGVIEGLNILGTTGRVTGVRPGMEGIVWVPADPNSYNMLLWQSLIGLPIYPDVSGLPTVDLPPGTIFGCVNGAPLGGNAPPVDNTVGTVNVPYNTIYIP